MSNVSWTGIYPALLTPFKENGEVDFEMFDKNLQVQVEAGVDGLIIGGSLGETSTLTNEEKLALLDSAKQLLGETRVPIIVNIAEQATAVAVAFAKEAELAGADGLMILPPMRYRADDRETVTFFATVAESTSLPIILYNNPVDYGIRVTLDMLEELAAYPNIQAIKESTRDLTNITRMINRFGKRFKILGGVDTIFLESLLIGADGIVGGLVDAFPHETVAIYRLAKAKRYDEALEIYRWFMPLLELDIHSKLVQYIKLAATAVGISNETVRAPRLPLEREEREYVLSVISEGIKSRPVLPDYLNLESVEA